MRDRTVIVLARRIYETAHAPPQRGALVIADGRVAATTGRRAALAHRPADARVLDLGNATLIPGLTDAHTHFFYWALQRTLTIDLTAVPSRAAAIRRVAASRRAVGDWVLGQGFDANTWTDGPPSAAILDAAVPDRPALFYSRDWHSAWLNTAALRRAGISARTPDPADGVIVRDARGRPTGILRENAIKLVPDPLRELARRTDGAAISLIDRALDGAERAARALGIVGVHSMDDGPSLWHLERRHRDGRLGIRVTHAVPLDRLDDALRLGLRSGLGDDWLRIGGLKIFSDGSLGSQTAYMFTPYPGRGRYCGVPVVTGAVLREVAQRAVKHGMALWVHAIGDRAACEVIDAVAATRTLPCPPMPHRIEHAQCVRARDIRRMARLGIVASVQPCHIIGDIATADRHWPAARRHAFPLAEMAAAGVTLALGSDVPVESIDPRRSLYGAVCRQDEHGEPRGGWFPDQRLSVRQALAAFTQGPAQSLGSNALHGTLRPGAPADMTVCLDDPFECDGDALLHARILGVIVGGRPCLAGAPSAR